VSNFCEREKKKEIVSKKALYLDAGLQGLVDCHLSLQLLGQPAHLRLLVSQLLLELLRSQMSLFELFALLVK